MYDHSHPVDGLPTPCAPPSRRPAADGAVPARHAARRFPLAR
ncbi:hypothetical protein [Streptomyces sp. NPDC003077]